jgi:hypothetical protein
MSYRVRHSRYAQVFSSFRADNLTASEATTIRFPLVVFWRYHDEIPRGINHFHRARAFLCALRDERLQFLQRWRWKKKMQTDG